MTFAVFAHKSKKDDNPAPGYYEIPSTFGSVPKIKIRERREEMKKESSVEYISSRSTLTNKGISLGPKKPVFEKKRSKSKQRPTPLYYPPTTFGQAPAFTIASRRSTRSNDNPGPGEYTPNDAAVSKTIPAFSCGTGKRFEYYTDNIIVPPGQYDIPSTIGKVPGAIMRPPGKKPFVHKSHPGPIYNIPSTIGANCPKYTIAKAQIKEKVEDTPGPASYQQLRNPVDPHKVGTLMKGRTKLPESVQCAAPYYDVPQGLEVKKVSIGHKPVVSFDNHVPGPGEYSPVIEEKLKGISIGVKREFTDSTLDVPGPGTYNLRNDEMPQQSIALPGPIDRSLINVNYEKTIPGPGQYTLPDLAEEMTPVTIGKRIEPNLNNKDNPPPYYSTHSTLGGPSFTIGLRT